MDAMSEGRHTLAGERAPETAPEPLLDLKAKREASGLSLNDIFRQSRVSLINLTAVENQDFSQLPPPVYTRDYIRKYARAIGIDEKPLLARYETYLVSLTPPPEETEVRKPWPENGGRYRFLFTTLGIIIAVGLLVYALYLYDQVERIPQPPPATQTGPAPAEPAPPMEQPALPADTVKAPEKAATIFEAREPAPSPVKPTVAAAPPPSQAQTPAPPVVTGGNHHLVIEARQETWVRITQDGTPRQILLKPGERIERSANEPFLLDVGNAGGISVTYQGKLLPPLGKSGEVVHIRLPERP